MVAELPKKQNQAMPGGPGGGMGGMDFRPLKDDEGPGMPGLFGKLTPSTARLKRNDACRFSFVTTMSTKPSGR